MVQENYHLYLTTVTGLMRQREQIEDAVVDVVKGTPVLVRNLATVVPGEEPVYNIDTARPDDAGEGEPTDQADGGEEDDQVGDLRGVEPALRALKFVEAFGEGKFEGDFEEDHQEDVGQAVEDVDEAHQR